MDDKETIPTKGTVRRADGTVVADVYRIPGEYGGTMVKPRPGAVISVEQGQRIVKGQNPSAPRGKSEEIK